MKTNDEIIGRTLYKAAQKKRLVSNLFLNTIDEINKRKIQHQKTPIDTNVRIDKDRLKNILTISQDVRYAFNWSEHKEQFDTWSKLLTTQFDVIYDMNRTLLSLGKDKLKRRLWSSEQDQGIDV